MISTEKLKKQLSQKEKEQLALQENVEFEIEIEKPAAKRKRQEQPAKQKEQELPGQYHEALGFTPPVVSLPGQVSSFFGPDEFNGNVYINPFDTESEGPKFHEDPAEIERKIEKEGTERKAAKESKGSQENYVVAQSQVYFYTTGYSKPEQENPLSGEVQFLTKLVETLNLNLPALDSYGKRAYYIPGGQTEQQILAQIKAHMQNHKGKTPVLHLLYNPPFAGSAFSLDGLRGFKKSGGKLIVTPLQSKPILALGKSILTSYIMEADAFSFMDRRTKKVVRNELLHFRDTIVVPKIEKSPSIPVTNLFPRVSSTQPRGRDILVLTTIRPVKNLAHIIELAKNLANNKNVPELKGKKILLAGFVPEHNPRNKELHRLVKNIYPGVHNGGSVAWMKVGGVIDPKSIKELIEFVHTHNSELNGLPIELHLNFSKDQFQKLVERSTYAFIPREHGANLANFGLVECVAQRLVVFSNNGIMTPKCLQEKGSFEGAMVLSKDMEFSRFAKGVMIDIIEREKNPRLNQVTLAKAEVLYSKALSSEVFLDRYLALYNGSPDPIESSIKTEKEFDDIVLRNASAIRERTDEGQVKSFDMSSALEMLDAEIARDQIAQDKAKSTVGSVGLGLGLGGGPSLGLMAPAFVAAKTKETAKPATVVAIVEPKKPEDKKQKRGLFSFLGLRNRKSAEESNRKSTEESNEERRSGGNSKKGSR